MSGIAGIYHFDKNPVLPEQIQQMSNSLFHRGPDKQGTWCDGNIGFANLLLQTTPESLHEELPYYDNESQIAITADARIDNRQELLNLLDCDKHQSIKISDSKLILLAYKKWGVDCHKHLLGDFAIVIWDKKEQRLFALRDHFGVKPLYYYLSNKFFAFASEIKALILLPQVPDDINEEKIADFMAIQDDGNTTSYKNIFRLRPAHFLYSNQTTMVEQRYWALEEGPILKLKDKNEYVDAFKEIFTESVHCRLRRVGPIGSHLSGGLDSSSITCTARQLLNSEGSEQLHTFSYIFEDLKECDEREYIVPIIEQGGLVHHFVQADQFPTKEDYDEIQEALEEVAFAFNVSPGWNINKRAHKLGVKVQLHGFDGDTTVSHGIGRLIELARSLRWIKLIKEGEVYASHFSIPRGKVTSYYLKNYSLLSYVFDKYLQIKKAISQLAKKRTTNNNQNDNCIFSTEFAAKIQIEERQQRLRRPFTRKTFNEQISQIQELTAHYNQAGLSMLDKAAAHFSVEKRFPFWDKRLIMFCLSLPCEQKLDNGWNRMIMRRAMEPLLPPSVCWRKGKTNLAPHANTLCLKLINDYNLRDRNNIAKVARYLDLDKVNHFLESPEDSFNSNSAAQFYRVIGLMLWLGYRERLSGWES